MRLLLMSLFLSLYAVSAAASTESANIYVTNLAGANVTLSACGNNARLHWQQQTIQPLEHGTLAGYALEQNHRIDLMLCLTSATQQDPVRISYHAVRQDGYYPRYRLLMSQHSMNVQHQTVPLQANLVKPGFLSLLITVGK